MTRLERKRKSLAALEKRMEGLNEQRKQLEHEVTAITNEQKRSAEILKMYRAGQIFKEAGILDLYEHDEVLQLLMRYRDDVSQKKKIPY